MTVTTTASSISYAGNGTTKAFAFPYVFFAPTDLVVTLIVTATNVPVSPPPVLNGAATYDYTMTGVVSDGEYPSGATVTFNTAPISGYTVLLVRNVPATQTVTLIDNTKFPAATINAEFDKLTVLSQQSTFLSGVSLQIPSYEVGLVVTAAPAASRANKLLLWDGSGNLTTIAAANIIGGSVPAGPAGGDLSGTYPNPAIKPSVTNGQVLTTVGGVTAWASGGTIIREVTLSSPAATIDLFSLGVKSCKVLVRLQAVTASADLQWQWTSGSTAISTSLYNTLASYNTHTNPGVFAGLYQPTLSNFLVASTTNNASWTIGEITIPDLSLTRADGKFSFHQQAGTYVQFTSAFLSTGAAGDGLRFLASSGNIAAGSFVRVIGWP